MLPFLVVMQSVVDLFFQDIRVHKSGGARVRDLTMQRDMEQMIKWNK